MNASKNRYKKNTVLLKTHLLNPSLTNLSKKKKINNNIKNTTIQTTNHQKVNLPVEPLNTLPERAAFIKNKLITNYKTNSSRPPWWNQETSEIISKKDY